MRVQFLLGLLLCLAGLGITSRLVSGAAQTSGLPRVAGAAASVSINSASLSPGQSADLVVRATAASQAISEFSVDVRFDPTLVTVTNCVPAPQGTCDPTLKPGLVRLTGSFSPGVTGTVALGTTTFAAGPTSGSTNLTLTVNALTDPQGQPIPAAVSNGSITITSSPPSATSTPGSTSTPPQPTSTPGSTSTPPQPTSTPSPTNTIAQPSPTLTATNTPVGPTDTPVVPTNTQVHPTATNTATRPQPTNTPPPPPTNTPAPGTPATGSTETSTATPVPPTSTQSPEETSTSTPSVPTPAQTPGLHGRNLQVQVPDRDVPVGDSRQIIVTLTRPGESVAAPGFEDYSTLYEGIAGKSVSIYFTPQTPTVLTLSVLPGRFDVVYDPDPPQQEMVEATERLVWNVQITPKEPVPSGRHRQDVQLRLTQSLKEGQLPDGVSPEVDRLQETFYTIGEPDPGPDTMDILKWALPGGIVPLVTGALIIYFNRKNISAIFRRGGK